MIVAFRQALAADADIVHGLSRDAISSISDLRGQTVEDVEQYFFAHEFDPENSALLETNGNTVGFVRLFVSNLLIVVNQLVIVPSFQSKGIGGEALAQLQARWEHAGLSASASVPKSRRSRAFFERAGFVHAGSGRAYDTLIWTGSTSDINDVERTKF